MVSYNELSDIQDLSVADVALSYPAARTILSKYKIDFCCGGRKLFVEACSLGGLDPQKIWEEIQFSTLKNTSENPRVEGWSPGFLADYIEENHHTYVRSAIPEIKELLTKVCEAHGSENPALLEVKKNFDDLAEELMNHMEKEEQVLFPAIRRFFRKDGISIEETPLIKHIMAPIAVMEEEHQLAGDILKAMRLITNEYTVPAEACPTYRLTFKRLEEFDDDLTAHIFLENNVLFEKVSAAL